MTKITPNINKINSKILLINHFYDMILFPVYKLHKWRHKIQSFILSFINFNINNKSLLLLYVNLINSVTFKIFQFHTKKILCYLQWKQTKIFLHTKLKQWCILTGKCINQKNVTSKSYNWTTWRIVEEAVENCYKSVPKLVSSDRRLIRGILIAFRLPIVCKVNLLSYGTWKLIKL